MKNKVYVVDSKPNFKSTIIEFILCTIMYAVILLIVNSTFKGFYIESFWYAVLASLIIGLLNTTIKPILTFLTLPLTIFTLGFFYPVVNLILLKITSGLMGSHFNIEGFLVPILIAIFISILRIVFDGLIIKPILRRVK